MPALMHRRGVTLCRLHLALGAASPCREEQCVFWEEGGAALPAGCGLQRLGIAVDEPELAAYLLDLRARLGASRERGERDELRHAFRQLVPPGLR